MSIERSDRRAPSITARAVFTLGRAADVPLQYWLFKSGAAATIASTVGLRASNLLTETGPGLFGLGPAPTLMLGLYSVASLRHIYWINAQCPYNFPVFGGVGVSVWNGLLNVANTAITVTSLSDLTYRVLTSDNFFEALKWPQWVGATLFGAGIFVEVYSELSRAAFKKDTRNIGKIDNTGLHGVVRHPNYAGYALWRVGAALATGSVVNAIVQAALQVAFFSQSTKDLSVHMAARYGDQWVAYTRNVPSKLIPGIF